MNKKLDTKAKIDIVLSRDKSLRDIAKKYGVHHSVIDELYKESDKILSEYFKQKSQRIGRPAKRDIKGDDTIRLETENKELKKQVAMKQMRVDWLELKLEFDAEVIKEANIKAPSHSNKKKEKIVKLTTSHENQYSDITQAERLKNLDLNSGSLAHIKNTVRTRLKKESLISMDDIDEAVNQIIKYPFLGGEKGSLQLKHDEKGLIGSTTYKDIKRQLMLLVEQELHIRHKQSELEKNSYKRYNEKRKGYEHIVPSQAHEIWSIDFIEFILYGFCFNICVVYEIFSQAYLAIKVSDFATGELAMAAIKQSVEYSGAKPTRYLLKDNGSALICDDVEKLLDTLEMTGKEIPPGKPWLNGALESGNRDFKKALYTIAFYDACKNSDLSKKNISREVILAKLDEYCSHVQIIINEKIARPKFKTTPRVVLNNNVKQAIEKQSSYVKKKLQERKNRAANLKYIPVSKRKRVEDKVVTAWKKVSGSLGLNEVFTLGELLNGRYRAIMI